MIQVTPEALINEAVGYINAWGWNVMIIIPFILFAAGYALKKFLEAVNNRG